MGSHVAFGLNGKSDFRIGRSYRYGGTAIPRRSIRRSRLHWASTVTFATILVAATAIGGAAQPLVPRAHAAPDPRVEYLYDIAARRQYSFPNNDALGYGYQICDKVGAGEGYAQVMGDAKRDVTPNDEFAANYLVSYAVNLLCPAQIWQLRNSAVHYRPPADS
jgi:hypothetical protein